jgi:hypothetical protein
MARKNNSNNHALGTALAVGAALSAAAGAFFLYGSKNAAKNRKKVSSWALRTKAEVMDKLDKVKVLTKDDYFQIVDNAVRKYAVVRDVTEIEAKAVANELKTAWNHIQRSALMPKTKSTKTKKSTTTRTKSKTKKS